MPAAPAGGASLDGIEVDLGDLAEMPSGPAGAAALEDLERRVQDLDETLEREPRRLDLLVERARALAGLARWEEAIHDFRNALELELEPRRRSALLVERCMCRLHLGGHAEALADAKAAEAAAPGWSDIKLLRAMALQGLDRPDEAILLLESLLDREPDNPRYLNDLAWAYALAPADRRREARALELAQRAGRLRPKDRGTLNTWASLAIAPGTIRRREKRSRRRSGSPAAVVPSTT